jgi:hypothetical protein
VSYFCAEGFVVVDVWDCGIVGCWWARGGLVSGGVKDRGKGRGGGGNGRLVVLRKKMEGEGSGGKKTYMAPPCVCWNSSTFFPSLSAACFCSSGWNTVTAVSWTFVSFYFHCISSMTGDSYQWRYHRP